MSRNEAAWQAACDIWAKAELKVEICITHRAVPQLLELCQCQSQGLALDARPPSAFIKAFPFLGLNISTCARYTANTMPGKPSTLCPVNRQDYAQ